MPFASSAQRSYLFIHHPDLARKWAARYGGGGSDLPRHVADGKAAARLKAAKEARRGAR